MNNTDIPRITSEEFFSLALEEANKYQDTGINPAFPEPEKRLDLISYTDLGEYILPEKRPCEVVSYSIHRDLPKSCLLNRNDDWIDIAVERKRFPFGEGKILLRPPHGVLRYRIKSLMEERGYPEACLEFNLDDGGEIVGDHITTISSMNFPGLAKIIADEHFYFLNKEKNYPNMERATLEQSVKTFFHDIYHFFRELDARERESRMTIKKRLKK